MKGLYIQTAQTDVLRNFRCRERIPGPWQVRARARVYAAVHRHATHLATPTGTRDPCVSRAPHCAATATSQHGDALLPDDEGKVRSVPKHNGKFVKFNWVLMARDYYEMR